MHFCLYFLSNNKTYHLNTKTKVKIKKVVVLLIIIVPFSMMVDDEMRGKNLTRASFC